MCCREKNSRNLSFSKNLKTFFYQCLFEFLFLSYLWEFISKLNYSIESSENKKQEDQKSLNFGKNGPNYKPPNIGMSSGNLANFAILGECNLAGNSLFQVFFAAFFNASLDSTNQQKMKKIWEADFQRCAIWQGTKILTGTRWRQF